MTRKDFLQHVFKLRGLLMLPPIVFVTLSTRWEVENEALVFGFGGISFGLGLLLRFWAQLHLHYRLRVSKRLTITGPYAFTRNPIYLGNCLILVGVCFFCELFWFAPVMLGWSAVVYHFVVAYEEAHLIEKYGEPYTQYLARVPRWIPRQVTLKRYLPMVSTKPFLVSSLLAEAHCLLFAVPPTVKELLV